MIGAKIATHTRYVTFLIAKATIPICHEKGDHADKIVFDSARQRAYNGSKRAHLASPPGDE